MTAPSNFVLLANSSLSVATGCDVGSSSKLPDMPVDGFVIHPLRHSAARLALRSAMSEARLEPMSMLPSGAP